MPIETGELRLYFLAPIMFLMGDLAPILKPMSSVRLAYMGVQKKKLRIGLKHIVRTVWYFVRQEYSITIVRRKIL